MIDLFVQKGSGTMSEFSNRFRQLKDESGLALKDLSEKLDISVPNLSYYMKGREPSYDILIRIAKYFNVTTDWLVGNECNHTSIETERFELIKENKRLKEKLSKLREMIDE